MIYKGPPGIQLQKILLVFPFSIIVLGASLDASSLSLPDFLVGGWQLFEVATHTLQRTPGPSYYHRPLVKVRDVPCHHP